MTESVPFFYSPNSPDSPHSPSPGYLNWRPYLLKYKSPIRTSRGSLSGRETFFLSRHTEESEEGGEGMRIGEAGYLPGLTLDDWEDYKRPEPQKIKALRELSNPDWRHPIFFDAPVLLFAWEMLSPGLYRHDTSFSRGEEGLPINGLVWMGDEEYQKKQIIDLFDRGFTTLKLKIGGLDFEKETALLDFLFQEAQRREVVPTVRLDANGGFTKDEALNKLERLSVHPIHSIEQPLPSLTRTDSGDGREDYLKDYQRVIRDSPIPIALDEELIDVRFWGEDSWQRKEELLDLLRPHYLVLKPGLHGGFSHCEEWIRLAGKRGMGWWITSALESNIGLTAIALWTAKMIGNHPCPYPCSYPLAASKSSQGLGTGGLYVNNIPSPLVLKGEKLYYDPNLENNNRVSNQ